MSRTARKSASAVRCGAYGGRVGVPIVVTARVRYGYGHDATRRVASPEAKDAAKSSDHYSTETSLIPVHSEQHQSKQEMGSIILASPVVLFSGKGFVCGTVVSSLQGHT